LELEEKQDHAKLYKLQFEKTQLLDDKVDLTQFKQTIITFKSEFDSLEKADLKLRIGELIQEITCYPKKVSILFHQIPWPIPFDIDPHAKTQ